ncbi:zinc finger matrin-type protein 1 [Periophthalmus magnuspinnatus]|uniref:zinc finger matrin-type protein 1 n=1 Tax=Periophthalmus magnuspinnatus TaxID=409849 RepID=UPI0024370E9B|nr:zinc finger matrin-type protein 1 [Periophthalmus magnuspinnatus]
MAAAELCAAPLADSDRQTENKVFKADPVPEFNTVTNTSIGSARSKDSEEEQLKHVLTESHCHLCDAVLVHTSQRTAHYQGKKHAMKLRTYLQMLRGHRTEGVSMRSLPSDRDQFCSLCNMVFSSAVVAKSHYNGKVHSKNLRKHGLPANAVFPSNPTSAQLLNSAWASSAPSAPLDTCKTSLPAAPSCVPSSVPSSELLPAPSSSALSSTSSSAPSSIPSSIHQIPSNPSEGYVFSASCATTLAKAPSFAPMNTSASSISSTTASPAPGSSSAPLSSFASLSSSSLSSSAPPEPDTNRFCSLCRTSFTHRQMALQHYGGKKHQRNQSRQEVLQSMEVEGGKADSLHCALCCLHFSSVEMYQAHMGGAKHINKEHKVVEMCRSQQKVYSSFNDELQDYIKVQQVRGLHPKPALKETNNEANKDSNQDTYNKVCKDPSDKLQDYSWVQQARRMHPKPALKERNKETYEDTEEDTYFYCPPPSLNYPVHLAWGTPGRDYTPQADPRFGRRKRKYRKKASSESISESSVSSDSSSEGEREKRRVKERRKGDKERKEGGEEMKHGCKETREGSEDTKEGCEERRKGVEEMNQEREKRRHRKRRRDGDSGSKRHKNQEAAGLEEERREEDAENSSDQGALQQARQQDSEKQRSKREKRKKEEDVRTEEERLWDDSILGC